MKVILIVSIALIVFRSVESQEENTKCSSKVCDNIDCPDIPKDCDIYLTSPSTCNCCKYCLTYLKKGDDCTPGGNDVPTPTNICGPGLTCKDFKCQTITETACGKAQLEFDNRKMNGSLGSMEVRPECDEDGFFVSYQCIPGQNCYCVNKIGQRIFGEIDYTTIPNIKLKCECSRGYDDASNLFDRFLKPTEHFRCYENGDYDSIECIGDKCYCSNPDGSPDTSVGYEVNIKEVSDESMSACFNPKVHKNYEYYKPCEQKFLDVWKEEKDIEKKGIKGVLLLGYPNCDPDGTYAPVQEDETHKYCVNKEGKILLSLEKTEANKDKLDEMNCNCIRSNLIMTTDEKPVCDEINGNYKKMQCRRSVCRCVDTNGNQICTKYGCEGEEDEINCDKP